MLRNNTPCYNLEITCLPVCSDAAKFKHNVCKKSTFSVITGLFYLSVAVQPDSYMLRINTSLPAVRMGLGLKKFSSKGVPPVPFRDG